MTILREKGLLSQIIILVVVGAFFSGCSGGEDAPAPSLYEPVNQGYFIDSAVEGLKYETPTHSGETNKDGLFFYGDGEIISFYIGDTLIGETQAKNIITPVDLVEGAIDETSRQVVNIARFLQTLDMDFTPANGITIPVRLHEIIGSMPINFDQDQEEFENDANLKAFMDKINRSGIFGGIEMELLPADECREHLKVTLDSIRNHDSDDMDNDDHGSGDDGQDQGNDSGENDSGGDSGTGGETGG